MSILQALAKYYDRLEEMNKVQFGFSMERISYAIVLSKDGNIKGVVSLLEDDGESGKNAKPMPKLMAVPQAVKRAGSGINPNFLWDKTDYTLGVKKEKGKQVLTDKQFQAFVRHQNNLLAESNDKSIRAVLKFLRKWKPDEYSKDKRLSDAEHLLGSNIVFQLEGGEKEYCHQRKAALPAIRKHYLNAYVNTQTQGKRQCLVTGEYGAIARLHPSIKGVIGAKTSGASIVSYNEGAFESFNKNQGDNAPISGKTAFSYTAALNHLLRRGSRQKIQIGDTSTVFWADAATGEAPAEAAEDLFSIMTNAVPTDEEESAAVKDRLMDIAKGRPLVEVATKLQKSTRFYVLGLAPNEGRISIRFWCADSIGMLAEKIREHWEDLLMEPLPWKTTPPSVQRLLRETIKKEKKGEKGKTPAQGEAPKIPPLLGGALIYSILTGSQYPRTLLHAIIMRIRSGERISGLKAAICKAYLARGHRLNLEKEGVPMSLDRNETNLAYRLGRLFRVYENLQKDALGKVNATIRKKYFGAASATPVAIFPLIVRLGIHHQSKLGNDKAWLASRYEKQIKNILRGMGTSFPRSLNLEAQGRFVLGYYHQPSVKKTGSGENGDDSNDKENAEE